MPQFHPNALKQTGFGGPRPFNYFVFGAAVSEVELDTLTGDWQLLRSDVVMDVGNPINPAIDIGQVWLPSSQSALHAHCTCIIRALQAAPSTPLAALQLHH